MLCVDMMKYLITDKHHKKHLCKVDPIRNRQWFWARIQLIDEIL